MRDPWAKRMMREGVRPRRRLDPFYCYINTEGRRQVTIGVTEDLMDAAEMAARSRDLDCEKYDVCLDIAARYSWQGFDCNGCPRRSR